MAEGMDGLEDIRPLAEDSVRQVGLQHMLGFVEAAYLDVDEPAEQIPPPVEGRGRGRGRASRADRRRDSPTLGHQHGRGFRQRQGAGGGVRGGEGGRGRGRGRGRARAGLPDPPAPESGGSPPAAPEVEGSPPAAPEVEGSPPAAPEVESSPPTPHEDVGVYFSDFSPPASAVVALHEFGSPVPLQAPQMGDTSRAELRRFAHSPVFEPAFDLSVEPSRGVVTQEGGDMAAEISGEKKRRAGTEEEEEEEEQPLRRSRRSTAGQGRPCGTGGHIRHFH